MTQQQPPESNPLVAQLKKLDLNPQQFALVVEYALNGGNMAEAARTVGYHRDYVYRMRENHPAVREALRIVDERRVSAAEDTLRGWADLHAEAREKIRELMSATRPVVTRDGLFFAPDNQVQLAAAKIVIEQHEGKPRQKVHIEDETERDTGIVPADVLRLALTLMIHRGGTLAEAVEAVRKNRKQVERWLRGPEGLPPAQDAEYEIIE